MIRPNLVVENSILADSLTIIKRREKQTHEGTIADRKRVAAYCRVSTDLEEQESSLKTQIESYTRIINAHVGWELVGIYADEGLSGTSVEKRTEFQRMIRDAGDGKIDVIMAKSISRFARNTQDTLQYTRYLQKEGVSVYFEKEGIDTTGFSSEFMLTILAAFAQEESHSISENTKRGIRNRFKMGIPMWSETYGLMKRWKINEEEAKDIRLIFELFIADRTVAEVADELNRRKIPTPGSTKKWDKNNTGRVLTNEKYVGDVLMQKTYVNDFIRHKSLENNDALVEQYYKKDHHEAIVDRETFNTAQKLYSMRNCTNGSILYPYYGVLKCPCCGKLMIKVKVTGAANTTAWTCGGEGPMTRLGDRTGCPTYLLQDKILTSQLVCIVMELEPYSPENVSLVKEIIDAQCGCNTTQKISYRIVENLVESITMDDWEHLLIHWKMGWSGRYEIKYKYLREVVLPIIDQHQNGRYYCFGNFVQNKEFFLEHFQIRQKRVLDYEVVEPLYGDCKIPKVMSPELQKRMEDRAKRRKI